MSAPAPRAALLAALVLAAGPAAALNPETIPLSADAALAAGAVLASDDPGGAGWYNPASLGGLRRSSAQLGASAYAVQAYELRHVLRTALPWQELDVSARDLTFSSVPSVLALSWRLREGLGLSLGVWTPFHAGTGSTLRALSRGPYPGVPGLTATYEQVYAWSTRADDTWVGAAVGVQLRPRLRLGLSVQGAYTTTSSAVDLETSVVTSSADPLEQGAHVNVHLRSDLATLAGRALGGLQWDATGALRLALVVRSPTVQAAAWGNAYRMASASALLPGFAPQVGQAMTSQPPPKGLSAIEPGRLAAGGQWTGGRWVASADLDWGPGLDRSLTSIRAGWNARAGARYRWDEDLAVGFGLFREAPRYRASQGRLALEALGFTAGASLRSEKVVRARGGGDWDLLTTVAVRGALARGQAAGMALVPFDMASSQLPILPGLGDRGFLEVPARTLDGSLHFFSTLVF